MQCPRTEFAVAGLSPSELSCKSPLVAIFLLTFFAILVTPWTVAQQQSRSATGAEGKARLPAPSNLTAELKSRLQMLESAKQSGDPVAVEKASRSVLGLGLREIAGLKLVQGSDHGAGRSARPTRDAIDVLRRSSDFEDSPATRIDLAQAHFQAKRFDESLSLVTDVLMAIRTTPGARYVQGKLWLTKNWYDEAVKSFRHTLDSRMIRRHGTCLGPHYYRSRRLDQAKDAFRWLAGSDLRQRARVSAGREFARCRLSAAWHAPAQREKWRILQCQRAGGAGIDAAAVSRGLAVGDLFNDGQLDVVVEDIDGRR